MSTIDSPEATFEAPEGARPRELPGNSPRTPLRRGHWRRPRISNGKPAVEVKLCIPDDQLVFLPRYQAAPTQLPAGVPLPRQGEIVYLTSSSAWVVCTLVHEWLSPVDLRIEVWLEHVGSARLQRPEQCRDTQ